MPEPPAPHPSGGSVEIAPNRFIAAEALRLSYIQSSGPGGQNVNKRATKCRLRVFLADLPLSDAQRRRFRTSAGGRVTDADELILESDEHRTQAQNRRACMDRLRELVLRSLVPPKKRIATTPTRGSRERRLGAKKQRGETKKRRRPPSADD